MFILISAVSYYFVTSSEITLNKYRKQVLALNDENVELQNKLDYLKANIEFALRDPALAEGMREYLFALTRKL